METAILAEGLAKRFGDFQALAGLDLAVSRGEVLGYLGPNGAGKTTTIRLLLGMLRPTSGRAEIFGLDVRRDTLAAHRRLAYVGGETSLWPSLTGAETLHLLGRIQGRADPAYRDELIERFALDPSKKVRSYSKGNRQKLALIAGLASRADLLLLDEPTSGLDPADGTRVPPLRARGQGRGPDRVLVLAHPERGRGAVRPGGDLAQRPAGRGRHAGRPTPPVGAVGGGHLIIGASLGVSRWLLDTSILHHVARAPAAGARWDSAAILVAIGVAAAVAGAAAFARRDLAAT